MDDLLTLVTVLIALSIASERLVEIIKGFIPYFNQPKSTKKDPKEEARRKAYLQIMAVAAGLVTAFLARSALVGVVPEIFQSFWGILALGLLASGGSGLWNSILAYFLEVKDLKKITVEKAQE